MRVFDLRGRQMAVLADRTFDAGFQQLSWQPGRVASGTYICRLDISYGNDQRFTRSVRMVYAK